MSLFYCKFSDSLKKPEFSDNLVMRAAAAAPPRRGSPEDSPRLPGRRQWPLLPWGTRLPVAPSAALTRVLCGDGTSNRRRWRAGARPRRRCPCRCCWWDRHSHRTRQRGREASTKHRASYSSRRAAGLHAWDSEAFLFGIGKIMCQRLRVKLRGCVKEAATAIRCVGSK